MKRGLGARDNISQEVTCTLDSQLRMGLPCGFWGRKCSRQKQSRYKAWKREAFSELQAQQEAAVAAQWPGEQGEMRQEPESQSSPWGAAGVTLNGVALH